MPQNPGAPLNCFHWSFPRSHRECSPSTDPQGPGCWSTDPVHTVLAGGVINIPTSGLSVLASNSRALESPGEAAGAETLYQAAAATFQTGQCYMARNTHLHLGQCTFNIFLALMKQLVRRNVREGQAQPLPPRLLCA